MPTETRRKTPTPIPLPADNERPDGCVCGYMAPPPDSDAVHGEWVRRLGCPVHDPEPVLLAPLPADPEPMTVHAALAAVMRDVNAVGKNRVNTEQRYNFRGIEDVMNALHGPLSTHGVVLLPEVLERIPEGRQTANGKAMQVMNLHVRFTFVGPAGDTLCCDTWGEGQDMADKATNKAMSAALKYALFQVFMVPTEEMQDSDRSAEPAGPAPEVPPPSAPATRTARGKAAIDAELKAMAASVNKAAEELVVKWEAANPKGWSKATANEQEAWLDYLRPYIAQQAAAIEDQTPPAEAASATEAAPSATPRLDALRDAVTPPEADVAREEDLPDGPAFPETPLAQGELPTDAGDPFAAGA